MVGLRGLRTHDGYLAETWEAIEDPRNGPPPRRTCWGLRCPKCGGRVDRQNAGPFIESRHSIWYLRRTACRRGCGWEHQEQYLSLGGPL